MTATPAIRAWALLPASSPLLHRLLALVLLLLVGGFLLLRLRRHGKAFQAKVRGSGLPGLRLGSLDLLPAERLGEMLHRLLGLGLAFVSLVFAYILLSLGFGLFKPTQGLAGQLLLSLKEPVIRFGQALLDYLPRGLVLVLIVLGTRMLLGLLRPLFDTLARGETRTQGFEADWAKPTYTLVRLGVLAFALVLAVPYLPGSGSEAFKAVSLFVGILVSLGSSGTIGNFISGSVERDAGGSWLASASGDRVAVAADVPPGAVTLMIRPEVVKVSAAPPGDGSPSLPGRLVGISFLGAYTRLAVETAAGTVVAAPPNAGGERSASLEQLLDQEVCVWWSAADAVVISHQ